MSYLLIISMLGIFIYLSVIKPQQNFYYDHHIDINGVYLLKPLTITDFEMKGTNGKIFNKNSLKDHWTFMLFGYINCNSACPTSLSLLDKIYRKLIKYNVPKNILPKVIFISIDTAQSNIDEVKHFINKINPNFDSAVTSNQNIESIKKVFHIISNQTTSNPRTFDHSPEILLINPDAKIQAYFSYPVSPDKIINDYLLIVGKEK